MAADVEQERSSRLWEIALAKARAEEERQKHQPLAVVVEIAKALRSVLHSDTLALSEAQLERGDAATVAYTRHWLEQHGLDLHGRPLDAADNRSLSDAG